MSVLHVVAADDARFATPGVNIGLFCSTPMVALSRKTLPLEARPWGRIFADHIGSVIANVRAYEEIQRLKQESQNKIQEKRYVYQDLIRALIDEGIRLKDM